MTENLRPVLIGDMTISADPDDVLVIYGLGSCVAVCLYARSAQVGGMLHSLLPAPSGNNDTGQNATKFVSRGVPLLLDSLLSLGANPNRLAVYLFGGAQVIPSLASNDSSSIGQRNIKAAETALQAASLKIQARDTGGGSGRTVKLYISNGQVTIRTLGQEKELLTVA